MQRQMEIRPGAGLEIEGPTPAHGDLNPTNDLKNRCLWGLKISASRPAANAAATTRPTSVTSPACMTRAAGSIGTHTKRFFQHGLREPLFVGIRLAFPRARFIAAVARKSGRAVGQGLGRGAFS